MHSARYTRVQFLDRFELGKQVPVGPKSESKKPRGRQNAPFSHVLFYKMEDGFIFHRILSKIVPVNLSVFSKYINQPSVKSPRYCATKCSRKNGSCRIFLLILNSVGLLAKLRLPTPEGLKHI